MEYSDAYKLTSSASNFIFTVDLNVWIKPLVFMSKFYLFDIGYLLQLKHE